MNNIKKHKRLIAAIVVILLAVLVEIFANRFKLRFLLCGFNYVLLIFCYFLLLRINLISVIYGFIAAKTSI